MYFIFVILTAVGAFYFFLAIARNELNDKSQAINGVKYHHKYSCYKNRSVAVFAIDREVDEVRFTIKIEKWYDGFFKFLKLVKEAQTDNDEFNKKLFLLSDQREVNVALKGAKELQHQVLEILNLCEKQDVELRRLEFARGNIILKLSSEQQFDPRAVAADFVNKLVELRKLFSDLQISPSALQRYKSQNRFLNNYAVMTLVLCLNGLGWFASYSFGNWGADNILNNSAIFHDALTITCALTLFIFILNVLIFAKTSRLHLELMRMVALFVGIWLNSAVLLGYANIDFDRANNQRISIAQVVKKEIKEHHSRRSGTYYDYMIEIDDVQNNGVVTHYSREISKNFYNSLSEKDLLAITHKPGFLGYEWITIAESKVVN